MIRTRITVKGKVHGVFFRDYVQKKAEELGDLFGWVANEADGSVTVVAEGPENKVRGLIDCCASGPSRARVEKVEAIGEPYTGEFGEFTIRY